jgi:hypothetical protein
MINWMIFDTFFTSYLLGLLGALALQNEPCPAK